MGRLRNDFDWDETVKYPKTCGNFKITRIRDVTTGYDSGMDDKKCLFPVSPDSQMITFYFEGGNVATIRNSGTEPKIKYYVECKGSTMEEAKKTTEELTKTLIDTFI